MNNAIAVVTSCSAKGWEAYGHNFYKTYREFWPAEVDLHIVSEDNLQMWSSERDRVWFYQLDNDFLRRHKKNPKAHGKAGTQLGFRFDAYKFSKKVFAIEMIAKAVQRGRLFWIDADVVTFASPPTTLFDLMLPPDYALSCLARDGYHSECGFVGYNLNYLETWEFIRAFANLYHDDTVFKLAEWHDSFVFDHLRKQMKTHTYEIRHKSRSHPFINSSLGKYMDHCKGKRKDTGRSLKQEQVVHTKLEYWKQT